MRLPMAVALFLSQITSGPGALEPSRTDWTLVVLVDVSISMHLEPREATAVLAAVHDGLVARLAPQDRARIGAFASEIRLPSPDRARDDPMSILRDSLTGDAEWRYGPSRLWDAVDMASAALAAEPGARFVVVVSDGQAAGNELSRAQVARNLQDRGVSLWVISVIPGIADDQLRAFASANGGRLFKGYLDHHHDLDKTALADALTAVLEALRAGWND